MKELFLNSTINYINKYNNYSDIKIKEIKYGLEAIYLTFSKLLIISLIAILLGIFKEMIIFVALYNIIRTPSLGLHATKSWICLMSSTILFIGIPIICMKLEIPVYVKSIVGIFCIMLMFKNSPADTHKRPIVRKKRREKLKFISVVFTIIYAIISIVIKENFISNCLLFSIIMQNFMISPTIYKIFKLPYNNYITFLKTHPEYAE